VKKISLSAKPFALLLSIVCTVQFCQGQASAASAAEYLRRANDYRFQGLIDAAMVAYQQAIKLDPNSLDAHVQFGDLLLNEKGDIDGAISQYVTALGIDRSCSICQSKLTEALSKKNAKSGDLILAGNTVYSTGNLTRAAAAYRLAVQADPKDASAHNSLSWCLYRLGDLDQALYEVQEALRLKPGDAEFVNTLACVLFDKGDIDGAISQFRKAISLSKTPAAADLYGLALALLEKGDRQAAISTFKQAVKADSHYEDEHYVRDRIGMSAKTTASHEKIVELSRDKKKEDKTTGTTQK
jgi:tetratricopeptide (TPR) repeat protein